MPNITKRLFFYIPFTILAATFLAICIHFRTAWPWHVPLHEDGQRTFFETVLYFEHALGELPLEVLLSAALAGWILWLYGSPAAKAHALWNVGIIAIALDATIFAGASIHVGVRIAVSYLLQYHTRDSEPMVFGSHWQYHLLAQLALMLLPAFYVAQVGNLRPIVNRPVPESKNCRLGKIESFKQATAALKPTSPPSRPVSAACRPHRAPFL